MPPIRHAPALQQTRVAGRSDGLFDLPLVLYVATVANSVSTDYFLNKNKIWNKILDLRRVSRYNTTYEWKKLSTSVRPDRAAPS